MLKFKTKNVLLSVFSGALGLCLVVAVVAIAGKLYYSPVENSAVLGAQCKRPGSFCTSKANCCKPSDKRLDVKCSWLTCIQCYKSGATDVSPSACSSCCSGKCSSCTGNIGAQTRCRCQ